MKLLNRKYWKGWTLGPVNARLLFERLVILKPKNILEFGSGSTTLLMATIGHVTALEHSDFHFDRINRLLREHKLDADVRLCPVVKRRYGYSYKTKLPDNIDFALIDGPPGALGRRQTFYDLYRHLAKDFVVWLDDAHRPDEAAALVAWQRKYPIKVEYINYRIVEITPK